MKRTTTSPHAHTRAPQRVLALWCPDWPVTAAARTHQLDPGSPIALLDANRIRASNSAARSHGVQRGLRLREAQARCPQLHVQPYRADEDARAFEPVLSALDEAVTGVHALRPGVCVIRARGPARYYGGEDEAALWLLDHVDALGIPGGRVGVADGVFTALHAARATHTTGTGPTGTQRIRIVPAGDAAAFLAPLPITVLDTENNSTDSLTTLLRRLGVYTLGDFAALDTAHVLDRFGPEGTRLHALAAGLDSRPAHPRTPPPEFDTILHLEPALLLLDQVAFAVRATADRFIDQLTRAKFVCTALTVQLESERGEHSERTWLHPRSFTPAETVDRVRWQLQGGSTETGLSSGITRITLSPHTVDPIGSHEAGLWGRGPDERIHHALSRLQSMLGHSAVVTAQVSGGRSVTDRVHYTPWGERMLHTRSPERPWPGRLPPLNPTTVYRPPHPVTVFAGDGTQVSVDDRGTLTAPPVSMSG
ncbi:MAG TPA: DNA polymerase Y family protein, partial [Terrimesophilobacter sp.]|nr:DNA polymerase Y family protein [Terrimesophilobacter sp.]